MLNANDGKRYHFNDEKFEKFLSYKEIIKKLEQLSALEITHFRLILHREIVNLFL